ncbi:MAG: glycosyltransferase family 4 protein [Calditrichaeota bacterium]|nr:glycosyltransferase family 4 protein [Calditrichota bacterium]
MLSIWDFKYLEDVIRQEKPDILHCHYLPDARFFLGLHRAAKIPLVVSAYGYDTSEFHRRFLGYGKRYLASVLREADLVLAMSPDMERDLRQLGCPPEKIRIHYHGVETSEFAWPERPYERSGAMTLLVVAGLDEYKGHIYFLRALVELRRRLPGTQFRARLVGQGPLEDELKAFVGRSGLDGVVEFVGFVPRANGSVQREFREADVFAMPSVTQKNGLKEGIPGALVEAMASGLPCVGTRHAGIPFVLSDEETGLLVHERDVSGLAEALERLMTDCELRRRLGSAAARKAASEFNCSQKIRELETIYLSLLG